MLPSPFDARNEHLKPRVWGYDRAQVDALLKRVRSSYEQAWRECDELRKRVAVLERELASISGSDGSLRGAVVAAELIAASVRVGAEEDARILAEAARAEAQEMVGKGHMRWEEVRAHAEEEARTLVEAARATAQEIVGEAEKRREGVNAPAGGEAQSFIEAARAEAQEIVGEAEKRLEEVNAELERFGALKEEVESGLRAFVLAALDLLDHETRSGSDDGRASSVEATPAATA